MSEDIQLRVRERYESIQQKSQLVKDQNLFDDNNNTLISLNNSHARFKSPRL